MATISIEFGKESSQKTREVYLLVRQGKTRQRVKTGVRLNEQEYSPKTKKIKSIEKARIVEKLRLDLIDNMSNLAAGAMAGDPDDAHTITKKIIKKQEKKELEFFAYAEDWVKSSWNAANSSSKRLPSHSSKTSRHSLMTAQEHSHSI